MSAYTDDMRRLRDVFMRSGYVVDPVMSLIGGPGQLALGRNHTIAAEHALAGRDDPLSTMVHLFILQDRQPTRRARELLAVDRLCELGILRIIGDEVEAVVDIRPFGDETDSVSGWVVSDHVANLNTRNARPKPDHVLGVSPASVSLSQITPRRAARHGLDLGTGSGYQSLHLVRTGAHVVATDVNSRALTLAALSFALNQVEVSTRLGSLYEPVADEKYDLIVTNPPFVISPPTGERLVYREGNAVSDDLMRAVVRGAGDHLEMNGSAHIVGNWAHVAAVPWQERLREWIPTGCDAFVVQRELLDPFEYIEVWLADAGLSGSPDYQRHYDQWLTYFEACKVEAVGMGWITLVKSGCQTSDVLAEHWPYPVSQPVGNDLMNHLTAMRWRAWSDDRLLDQKWLLAPGVIQETLGLPGQADPSHVVFRRHDGLQRAVEVDQGLGGILGACDGELSLRRIIAAVAEIIDVDTESFGQEMLPRLRQLIAHTWLSLESEPDHHGEPQSFSGHGAPSSSPDQW